MPPFVPTATISAASALLLVCVYLYLYVRQREACFALWAAAVAAFVVRVTILVWISVHGASPVALIGAELVALAGVLLMAWATRLFVGLTASIWWRLFQSATALAAVWLVYAGLTGVPGPLYYTPASWLMAASLFWSGAYLLAGPRMPRPSNRFVGWAFVLLGVLNFAYPRLHTEAAAPVAYLSAAALRAIVGIGTLIACLESVRQQLADSEERYRLLTEMARDVILLIDGRGVVAYANDAGRRLLGVAADGPVGRPFADFIPEAERDRIEGMRHQCLTDGTRTHIHDLNIVAAGGAVVPMETNCSLLPSPGGEPTILLVARDTSERKRQERFLSALMANLPGMVYRCQDDRDWTLTYVSDGARQLAGIDLDALSRGEVTHAALIHPTDLQRVHAEVAAAISDGRAFEIEYRLHDASGGEKWVRERGHAVDTEDGHYSIEGFISDISESRRLAEELRQAQKMEEIGRLAGGIAHDFNNLLTAVTGYGHFLKAALPSNHEAQQDVSGLLAAAERATQLTRQLLAFSRRQAIEARPVNLNELVTNMGQMMRRLIGEDIEISVITDDALRPVEGDSGQLELALVNLVVNARDAMPDGGRLVIETARVVFGADAAAANPAIHVGEYAMLSVSDTGVGMTQEVKDHLFEPFFTTKEVGRGTGLGLAMVYGIVQQHRGDIRAYSEPGVGSVFKLYLPCLHGESTAAAEPATQVDLPRGGETILIAEDEASVRNLVLRILADLGYTVLEAGDGSEALARADAHDGTIDLLLADLVMPLMGGRQLDTALRQKRPELRTLFMSGYTDSAVLNRGLLGPDAAFLQKPFSARALAVAVRRALDPGPAPAPRGGPRAPRPRMTRRPRP